MKNQILSIAVVAGFTVLFTCFGLPPFLTETVTQEKPSVEALQVNNSPSLSIKTVQLTTTNTISALKQHEEQSFIYAHPFGEEHDAGSYIYVLDTDAKEIIGYRIRSTGQAEIMKALSNHSLMMPIGAGYYANPQYGCYDKNNKDISIMVHDQLIDIVPVATEYQSEINDVFRVLKRYKLSAPCLEGQMYL